MLPHLLYELSRYKYRILVSSFNTDHNRHNVLQEARLTGCKEGIDTWLPRWKDAIKSASTDLRKHGNDQLPSWLDLYGQFYHSEALLLYGQTRPDAVPPMESATAARQVIRSFSALQLRQTWIGQQQFLTVAPLPWTAVHSLCIAGTFLVDTAIEGRHGTGFETFGDDVDLCISLLSSLENNLENAAAGLSASLDAISRSCRMSGTVNHGDFHN
jgi:hypothetical protein